MKFLSKLFDSNEKQISKYRSTVDKINSLEDSMSGLSHDEIKNKTKHWQEHLKKLNNNEEERKKYLNSILPETFALVRESAKRSLGLRHHDVQLISGIALHEGKISEQKTGEGKTLTATSPLYLNALTGLGTHLVTPNDYLSSHHAAWMGPLYDYLGLTVGVIIQDGASFVYDSNFDNPEFLDVLSKKLKPVSRKEAYMCDITYGTNHEFGFDYLRDNRIWRKEQISQTCPLGVLGIHNFAIVDEVDSILIDVARTPLIISEAAEESTQKYYEIANLVKMLQKGSDYEVEEKQNFVSLTDLGIRRVEKMLGIDNLYEKDFDTLHHIEQALKAIALFQKDKDYVVKEGKVVIVDQFTGRLLPSNRYSEGLHQAIEAKEGLEIQRESRTLAEISYQNYFRMYKKLAGMTGTAETEAEEFYKIYKLDVVVIPTHRPNVRQDLPDMVYKNEASKFRAVADEIVERYQKGQPVLVGTTSVEKSELLHQLLKRRGISHEILNAKNHEREALIIAQAGRKGSVTVSTNMAGRGVDILLGGDPVDPYIQEDVRALGGLHVIGTERHESRRIDNQLRGRSGRQGDPGSSRFYVSLQDDLMRIFGGAMVENLMDRFGMDENTPLESKLVTAAIENAQKKVEGHNFDIRKRVVEYDDVMNTHREVIYKLRKKILGVGESNEGFNEDWVLSKLNPQGLKEFEDLWIKHKKSIGDTAWFDIVIRLSLEVVDHMWIEHLEDMDKVREGINLRGYAQKDPLIEYKKEAHERFTVLVTNMYSHIAERIQQISHIEPADTSKIAQVSKAHTKLVYQHGELETGVKEESSNIGNIKVDPVRRNEPKIGRNDPCPCGAMRSDGSPVKYKNCHGKGK